MSEYCLPKMMRVAMAAKSITYAELSRRSGVSRKTLYKWGEGRSPRSLIDVSKVAEALGLTIEELAFGARMLEYFSSK